jgi:hypothetical protein
VGAAGLEGVVVGQEAVDAVLEEALFFGEVEVQGDS